MDLKAVTSARSPSIPARPARSTRGRTAAGCSRARTPGGRPGGCDGRGLDHPRLKPWPLIPTHPARSTRGDGRAAGECSAGVFKSTDGARPGARPAQGADTNVIALAIGDPNTPSTLYAGTGGGGVFKSTDAGATWSAANAGLPNTGVYALAIDPSTPGTLYALSAEFDGGYPGSPYKSTTHGRDQEANARGC